MVRFQLCMVAFFFLSSNLAVAFLESLTTNGIYKRLFLAVLFALLLKYLVP